MSAADRPLSEQDQSRREAQAAQRAAHASKAPYLNALRLENFGRFHDRLVAPFKPGLNVVYGPNEAGKSTVTAFIRQALYGWTSTRGAANVFDPLAGKRSGSLFFHSDEGEWELRRGEKRDDVSVIRHEGQAWPTAFDDIREGVAEDTYRTVFTFNADELMSLPSDSGSLSAKLFTAGSGTHDAPVNVLDDLRASSRQLRGSSQNTPDSIGNLQSALKAADEQVVALEEQARGYTDERVELEQLETQRQARAERLAALNEQAAKLESDGTRARAASERLARLSSEKDTADTSVERLVQQEESLRPTEADERLVTYAANIESALKETQKLQSGLDRMKDYDERRRDASARLNASENHDSDVDRAVYSEMKRRGKQAVTLASRTARADEELKKAMTDERAAENEADQLEQDTPDLKTEPRRNLVMPGRVLAVLGCLGIVAAIVFATVARGVVDQPYVVGACGVLLVVVGVLLAMLGRSRPDTVEIERRRRLVDQHRDAAKQRKAHALAAYATASEEEQAYSADTADFLDAHGYAIAQGDLDLALEMYAEQENYNRGSAELTSITGQYGVIQREFNNLYSLVKKALKDADPDIDRVAPADIVAHINDLHAALQGAKKRSSRHEGSEGELQRARQERDRLSERIHEEREELAGLARGNDLGVEGDVAAELAKAAAEKREQIAALEQEQDEASARHGSLVTTLEHGARETDLQRARLEREELRSRLARSARRYAELLCAQALMTNAIELWEQKRQPEVYRIASRLFAEMTGGAWVKVESEGDEIFVYDAGRKRFPTKRLSTGTTQQLYLSLRIALLLVAEETGRSLPIVADDILVSFDASRRLGAAHALRRLAERRQVILFTCHRDTQELFVSLGDDVNTFDLSV